MKQVAIWPSPWNYRLKNHMFEGGYGPGGAYLRAFQLWRDASRSAGIELNTWDMTDLDRADLLFFIDLPSSREEFERARRLAPRAKTILMICESPLICPQMFLRKNRDCFDWVVSYEPTDPSVKNRLHYKLPVTIAPPIEGPSYEARRLLGMVNSNRVEGYFGVRQLGLQGLPGIGRAFNGWSISWGDLIHPARNDLYSTRRRLGRIADAIEGLQVDFFGKGWNGEQMSWCPLYHNKPYGCYRGKFVEDRLATLSQYRFSLAYENWRGDIGYLTDRLFDGFLAGAVPVYFGDAKVDRIIPAHAFVDARNFANQSELLLFLKTMDRQAWMSRIEAGREFLNSPAAREFDDSAFAGTMTSVLGAICRG